MVGDGGREGGGGGGEIVVMQSRWGIHCGSLILRHTAKRALIGWLIACDVIGHSGVDSPVD